MGKINDFIHWAHCVLWKTKHTWNFLKKIEKILLSIGELLTFPIAITILILVLPVAGIEILLSKKEANND